MTLRITLGIDPGVTGAIVVLADGEPVQFIDIPTFDRPGGGKELDPFRLCATLRGVLQQHSGASVFAVLEEVGAFSGEGRRSGFRFGEGFGIVKGVLGGLSVRWCLAPPRVWKKHFQLIGTGKDAARQFAIQRWPKLATAMMRKRDIGRADALLIARWGFETEAFADAPLLVAQRGR